MRLNNSEILRANCLGYQKGKTKENKWDIIK